MTDIAAPIPTAKAAFAGWLHRLEGGF